MLEQAFLKLLHMSFAAAWLALAVAALRPLLRKAPRRVILLLWALVAVRLVCPVSIESPVSLVPRPETVVQSVPLPQEPAAEAESAAHAVRFHPERLWLAGTGAMLLWGLWSDLRLRRRVQVSIPEGENVRICDEIDTPFVLGIVRPKIYLPSELDDSQAVYVLAHERAHIARRDHWWKPLGWVLLSVYWFHPLLWLSYVLFCRDLELACDERVAASLDREGLAAYSDALLRCSVRRGALASPVAFGETGVKTRVRAILRYRKPALRVVLSALLCVVVVGALFLTDRPAVAAKVTEIILPEITPLQENDWTIQLDDWNELPAETAEPTPAPTSAVPAGQTVQTAQTYTQSEIDLDAAEASMQDFIRQENERIAQAYSEAAARNRANGTAPSVNMSSGAQTVAPGSSSSETAGTGTPQALIAGADGNGTVVHQPSDFNPVQQYGDTTVIRLVP